MSKYFLKNEVVFREFSNQVSSSSQLKQSPKLHQCALVWSYKCFHCESAYDKLKQKLTSLNEPSVDNLNELIKQIEKSLATLKGFFISLLFFISLP